MAVELALERGESCVAYNDLARALEIDIGAYVPAEALRTQVLALRASKGMLISAKDPDSWGVGSFFTNPVIASSEIPQGAPYYPISASTVKIPAAWLIENSGFTKGYPGENASVRLSTKHTLAITNRGSGTTAEVLTLARTVQAGVLAHYGIRLIPEPVFINCTL